MTHVSTVIRPAVADDLDAILAIDQAAARGDIERIEVLRLSLARGECHVHVSGDTLSGYLVVKPEHFFGRDFIDLLSVDVTYRRQGIGRSLLRAAVAAAGTPRLFTSTNTSNAPMRSLLASEFWMFGGELDGLDEGDPELVFYTDRSAGPATAS